MTLFKLDLYKPRTPRKNKYYRLVEAHHEKLDGVWEERYQSKYGFWRPYVKNVIYKYLDCGDPHFGFARVRCGECGHEYLLPFSCKRRYFCPSCRQKHVIEFGANICMKMFLIRYHIGSGYSQYPKDFIPISCMIASFW